MSLFNQLKDSVNKENLMALKDKAQQIGQQLHLTETPSESTEEEENVEVEETEKGAKMLQVMDWAFDKANGNIPGFGTSQEMATKYLEKYGSVGAAIDHMVNWQITSAATAGFVTSLGGLPTMAITLPANIAGVMAIQLRMIGAIAELGGFHESTEEKKTGMYLCLLGSQAGDVLSKTAGQFAVKFATASLKKLPGAVLTKINQAVGFRLVTKFGEKGLVNINKAIPILGGIVGGTVDALSTYAIAKAAKALFLNEIIDMEKQEQLEIARIHCLINMALVDGVYSSEEGDILKILVSSLNISDKGKKLLFAEIEKPKRQTIDYTPFKEDLVLSSSLMSGLTQLASADGTIHPAERLYLMSLGKEIGMDETMVNAFMQQ